MKFQNIVYLLVFSMSAMFFMSCGSDEDKQPKVVDIYLTDCPFDAEKVNVEILSIFVEDDQDFLIELNTVSGVYDLLEFADGIDTLIASGNVDFDEIKNIYMDLGEDNTIVIDGETYPLIIKAEDKRVKIKVNLNQLANDEAFLIDFFACTSIVERNGEYYLKPVIKFKGDRINGHNDDDLEDLLEDLEDCFEVVYPVNFLDTDGNTVEVNSKEELIDLLKEEVLVEVVYPINVVDAAGAASELTDEEALEALIEACEDDEDEEDDDEEDAEDFQELVEDIAECYDLVFPVVVIDLEGEAYTAEDQEDFISILDNQVIVDFQYPITIEDQDGEMTRLENENKLEKALDDCDEDDDDDNETEAFIELVEKLEECYVLVYPLSVVTVDGVLIEVGDSDELQSALEEMMIVQFDYPIVIEDKDGELERLENRQQVQRAIDDCDDEDDDDDDDRDAFRELLGEMRSCFDLVFPVTVVNADDDEFMVDSYEVLLVTLEEEGAIGFVYPITVQYFDEEMERFENKNKLYRAIEDCQDGVDAVASFLEIVNDLEDCYPIEYPVSVVDADRNEFSAETLEDLYTLIEEVSAVDFAYPISVEVSEGEFDRVENSNRLERLLDECHDENEDDDAIADAIEALSDCYSLVYPLSFTNDDAEVFEAQDEDELEELIEEEQLESFIYPFQVTDQNGEVLTVGDDMELRNLIEDC